MFLANDPWVGAAHQQDVMLICPVFHEDELFCWVTNCLHQYDIGGITPSSFCPAAESAYDEGILIPPVKIVEKGVIRRDIEELYLRASRKPEMVALDFRAQLAGNTTAKTRIAALIERYGPATVKGVMKRIIDNAEKAFLDKMARLPDGDVAGAHLRRVVPAGGPAHPPGDAHGAQGRGTGSPSRTTAAPPRTGR